MFSDKKMQMDNKSPLQSHGGDIYRNSNILIDFSVNVNPLGPRPEVIEAIRTKTEQISNYPDMYCEKIIEALSRFERVPPEFFICGNGAAELFLSVVLAVKPKRALLLAPTFSEYERALKIINADVFYYELREAEEFLVREDILDYITPDMDMVFLCNPNNPTGQCILGDLMERIAEKCKDCKSFLVVDECFVDFLDTPWIYEMKGKLDVYPNLLIVKALTKLFCIPGLRIGYGMCGSRKMIHRMRNVLQSWNVSVLAQTGGIVSVENCEGYMEETKKLIRKEREFLAEELKKLGYKVYGSKANYIFFKDVLQDKRNLYDAALNAGFLIRDCSDYRGLERGYYRIAVRLRPENERIITWLKQLWFKERCPM